MKTGTILLAVLVTIPTLGATAQDTPRSGGEQAVSTVQQNRILQLQRMEHALEEAVARGVRVVEEQLSSVLPGLVLFAGSIQARGFVLDDYGVFFDVEYPVVRRSLLWSINMFDRMEGGMSATFRELRRRFDAMPQGPGQLDFNRVLAELEAEFQRPMTVTGQRIPPEADGGTRNVELAPEFDSGCSLL